jgi:hypothetical protein
MLDLLIPHPWRTVLWFFSHVKLATSQRIDTMAQLLEPSDRHTYLEKDLASVCKETGQVDTRREAK